MPPKADGKKGGGAKALLKVASVNAFLATYKAASRRYGVPPLKSILTMLEESIAEGGTVMSKVRVANLAHTWRTTTRCLGLKR